MSKKGFFIPSEYSLPQEAPEGACIGRVISEHRERYTVRYHDGVYTAGISGKMMFRADSQEGFPAVGDWVILIPVDEENAVIEDILPRKTIILRRSRGRRDAGQVIAANLDTAFVVMSGGEDFSVNRMERYLALIHEGGIEPVVLLNKCDLYDKEKRESYLGAICGRHPRLKVLPISAKSGEGSGELRALLQPGKSYCFLGSSGVGKSTLINLLANDALLQTRELSDTSGKGVHTTTYREMFELDNGSFLIDTPGLREVGLTDADTGIAQTFDDIAELAQECRFSDCSHSREPGCAVRTAVEDGRLSPDKLENYLRLKKESEHYQTEDYRRRQKDKQPANIVREFKRIKKKQ